VAYCVYTITHRDSGKFYVGISINPHKRWREHKNASRKNPRYRLHRAINKYGSDAFEFRVVAGLPTLALSKMFEISVIRFGKSDYNMTPGGDGGGYKHTPETIEKLRAQKGWKHRPEVIASFRGRVASPETRAKISASKKGVKRTPEACAKQSLATKGKPKSEAWKAKMRGRKFTEEQKRRMSDGKFKSWARKKALLAGL
jgi:group I intron endonuclease